jgi:hypothetical protein
MKIKSTLRIENSFGILLGFVAKIRNLHPKQMILVVCIILMLVDQQH